MRCSMISKAFDIIAIAACELRAKRIRAGIVPKSADSSGINRPESVIFGFEHSRYQM